jgi:hypothetical protein
LWHAPELRAKIILSAARVAPEKLIRISLPRRHHAACSGGRAMKDADDPIPTRIPEDTIFFREERLNPASPYYDAFQEQHDKDRAYREAGRTYDEAQRFANEWLRERITQGILTALISDPDTGQVFRLSRHKWASMDAFETGIASNLVGPHELQSGPKTIIKGKPRPVFFDHKFFDKVLTEIATSPVINKGGRPPEYDWDAIKAFALEKIRVLGKPGRNNKRLPSKAQLIEIIQTEWSKRYDQHPPVSSLKKRLNQWLAEIDRKSET